MIERTQAMEYLAEARRKEKKPAAGPAKDKKEKGKKAVEANTPWDKRLEGTFPASDAVAKY